MKSLSASSSIIGGLFLLAILFYILESNHGVHLSDLPSRGATRPEKIVSRSDSADHVPYSTVASKKPIIPIVGRENHSNIPSVPVIPFTAWESHANVHSSKPFEVYHCISFLHCIIY